MKPPRWIGSKNLGGWVSSAGFSVGQTIGTHSMNDEPSLSFSWLALILSNSSLRFCSFSCSRFSRSSRIRFCLSSSTAVTPPKGSSLSLLGFFGDGSRGALASTVLGFKFKLGGPVGLSDPLKSGQNNQKK